MITELYEITKKLFHHVQQPFPKDEREHYIEKVHELLDLRQKILNENVPEELSAINENIRVEIIQMDKEINEKMKIIQSQIKTDINKLMQQKETGKKYENQYQGEYTDGIFIDKKN